MLLNLLSAERLFTLLEEIKSQNTTAILLLQQLAARSLRGEEVDVGPVSDDLVLPLKTMEDIQHLDVLVQDANIRGRVVCTR